MLRGDQGVAAGDQREQVGVEVGADRDGLERSVVGDGQGAGDLHRHGDLQLQRHPAAGPGDQRAEQRVDLPLPAGPLVVGTGRAGEQVQQPVRGDELAARPGAHQLRQPTRSRAQPHPRAGRLRLPPPFGRAGRVQRHDRPLHRPAQRARGVVPAQPTLAAQHPPGDLLGQHTVLGQDGELVEQRQHVRHPEPAVPHQRPHPAQRLQLLGDRQPRPHGLLVQPQRQRRLSQRVRSRARPAARRRRPQPQQDLALAHEHPPGLPLDLLQLPHVLVHGRTDYRTWEGGVEHVWIL